MNIILRFKNFTMKLGLSFVLCALITIGCSAPQDRNVSFFEHVEDFVGVILAESGPQLEQLLKRYGESKEFGIANYYLKTKNFRDVLLKVESLPEFKAVEDYLKKAHIYIDQILSPINELTENNENVTFNPKETKGKMDVRNFIRESINIYPKQKLAELFEQKLRDYPKFRHCIEKLNSEEFKGLYQALCESDNFKKAESILADHGLDFQLIVEQVKALFGQN